MSLSLRNEFSTKYDLGYEQKDDPLSGVKTGVQELGHPEDEFDSVHVTASKGAGSTSAFADRALREAGYDVGLFSGELVTSRGVREKFQVNGDYISEDEFWSLAETVLEQVTTRDEWDILVLMGLEYFRSQDVDIAIFEAGIGGETDSTNIIHADLCIITNAVVTPNHPDLGDTDREVARNKAGIIHEGSVAVSNGNDDAKDEIRQVANERNATFYPAREAVEFNRGEDGTFNGVYNGEHADSQLVAQYLCQNINTVVTGIEESKFTATPTEICSAIEKYVMPGRCELVKTTPKLLLDGASNAFSANALLNEVQHLPNPQTLIFAGPTDCWEETLEVLEPHFDTIIAPASTEDEDPEAFKPKYPHIKIVDTCQTAIEAAREVTPHDATIVVTGSLYLVRDVRLELGLEEN